MSSFTSPLKVEHINGKMWKLLEPFSYYTEAGKVISVPEGFLTDFASIPRPFWSIIGHPTGQCGKAAILHDWLYHTQECIRKYADLVFLEAMEVLDVSWWRRRLMYRCVRMWGWIGWNRRKREIEIKFDF